MSQQYGGRHNRNLLAVVFLPVILVTSVMIAPQQASSSTPLSLLVVIEGQDQERILNKDIALEVCHEGTGEWVCDNHLNSGPNGEVSVTISSLPNGTGFVFLGAGGNQTDYSRTGRGVSFRNGISDDPRPVITLVRAEWIAASITVESVREQTVNGEVEEFSEPVEGEYVQLSTLVEGMGDPWPMEEWAQTNDDGVAVFKLDPLLWRRGKQTVTARVGVGGFGSQAPAEINFVIEEGESVVNETISTSPISYTLSGVVTDENNNVVDDADLCMHYTNQTTRKRVEIDFPTDELGRYSIPEVKATALFFQRHPCGYFDEDLNYDHHNWYDATVINSAATVNPRFTRTGIKVTFVDDDGDPAAFVQVGLEARPLGEHDHRRQAVTNQDGEAFFSSLDPTTLYEVSYKHSDRPWEARRFLDNTKADLIQTLDQNTVIEVEETFTLRRVGDFPPTPATLKGRLLDASNTPIANGIVQIDANFGTNGVNHWQFRARTDQFGRYEVSGLPEGKIFLAVSAKGYRAVKTEFETTSDVRVYNQGDFRLRPSVVGTLEYTGVLRNTSGQPIPDMELVLNKPFDSGGGQQKTTTDSKGNFAFTGLNRGHHWLFANSDWEQYEWTDWGFDLTGNRVASLVLVGRGMKNPDAQASISGRVFEYKDIEGPSAAVPIEDYCVDVFPVEGGTVTRGETDADGNWTATGLVAGERYFIGHPGPCVPVTGPDVRFDFERKYEFPRASADIVIARVSGGTAHQWVYKEVSQTGSGSISGRLRDGEDYSNLAGMEVNLERANGGRELESVITDSRGEYRFTNLPAGEYYLSIGDPFIGDVEYWDSWTSVEVTTEANRANILLWKKAASGGESENDSEDLGEWNGVVSGTVLDESSPRKPHGSAQIEVFDSEEGYFLGFGSTDNEGEFQMSGLPTETDLVLKIIPWWTEIAIAFVSFVIGDSNTRVLDIRLDPGTSISGEVSNIPQGVELRQIYAELVNASTGVFIHSSPVNSKTGQYVIGQVPNGQYKIRFTQNPFGGRMSGHVEAPVSMKPVYWNGSQFGTTDGSSLATWISVTGTPVITRNVTYSEGSSIRGSVSIASVDGLIPVSGSRTLWVELYRKNGANFTYFASSELSARTNYGFQFVGISEGEYKISFRDTRSGGNSLTPNFNGGALSLSEAIAIEVGEEGEPEVETLNHVMEIAPPETSAEAFDLESLSAERLLELKDEISLAGNVNPGSELDIFVGKEFSGDFVSAFANSTPVLLGDWQQVDSDGYITVVLPATLASGDHRVGVQDSRSTVFGWAPLSISGPDSVAPNRSTNPTASISKSRDTDGVVESESEEENTEPITKEETLLAPTLGESSSNDWLLPLAGGFLMVAVAGSVWVLRSRRRSIFRRTQ